MSPFYDNCKEKILNESEENFYYICKRCVHDEGKDDEEKACKLTTNTSPGIPPVCPFDLGFEPEWIQVDKKEYEEG